MERETSFEGGHMGCVDGCLSAPSASNPRGSKFKIRVWFPLCCLSGHSSSGDASKKSKREPWGKHLHDGLPMVHPQAAMSGPCLPVLMNPMPRSFVLRQHLLPLPGLQNLDTNNNPFILWLQYLWSSLQTSFG